MISHLMKIHATCILLLQISMNICLISAYTNNCTNSDTLQPGSIINGVFVSNNRNLCNGVQCFCDSECQSRTCGPHYTCIDKYE